MAVAPSAASLAYHSTVKNRKRSASETARQMEAQRQMAGTPMPGGKPLSVDNPPDIDTEEKHIPPALQTGSVFVQHRSVSEGGEKAFTLSPLSPGTSSTLTPNGSEPSPSIKIIADVPARRSHEGERNEPVPKDKKLRNVSSASGIRQKSKKQNTSAYTEGLKNITPTQAALEGDFSGWMKKRGSGGVVSTWKSRFFVLKGRRLSYYYSMDDTKERGLIDITSHRVLPAADDRLVQFHASVAAITSSTPADKHSSASPGQGAGGSAATSPTTATSSPPQKGSWFTFKLVPPAPGTAKGVTFTPPRLHYFATDTRTVGRQWMAAFMKATIDRDISVPVVSTFTANTITLAKARALRARPPGLESTVDGVDDATNGKEVVKPVKKGSGRSSPGGLGLDGAGDDDAANAADDER